MSIKTKSTIFSNKSNIICNQSGMSLVEAIVSITLLSLFFTFYTIFVEVASKYNKKEQTDLKNSNGLVIDQHYLSITLDKYSDFLSQPGIKLADINYIKSQQSGNLPIGCTFSPNIDWQIPINQKPISEVDWQPSNAGYAICLKSTSLIESSLSDLISKSKGNSVQAYPGLYFLIAIPNELSINKLPMRKLFCRPHPFC
tara:strand:- start:1016 stop:1612 length:597 start_codon:yes stop_codon:yes gene_type:complete